MHDTDNAGKPKIQLVSPCTLEHYMSTGLSFESSSHKRSIPGCTYRDPYIRGYRYVYWFNGWTYFVESDESLFIMHWQC